MLDFINVQVVRSERRGTYDIYPEFVVSNTEDLMIRGHTFYAIWNEAAGCWTTSMDEAVKIIDNEVRKYANELVVDGRKHVVLLSNFSTKKYTEFQQYCKQKEDHFYELDSKVTFLSSPVRKEDYSSKRLAYDLSNTPAQAYEEIMSTLYDPGERRKLEWAIGSVLAGDGKDIQKFVVLYGEPGSGKSTVLHIIESLFEGYTIPIDFKAITSNSNQFALEMMRSNPLIGIQHDGDLSRVEDNTRLNSLVSHERMVINEKYKAPYSARFNSFLFLATNKPVKITDAKSGLIRRVIDVSPSGRRLDIDRYDILMRNVQYELGSIAQHCLNVYRRMGPDYYNRYMSMLMISYTNDVYNFMQENYEFWAYDNPEGVTLNTAWLRYKEYCADANVQYPLSKRTFKIELQNYFQDYQERFGQKYNWYSGFMKEKFDYKNAAPKEETRKVPHWLIMTEKTSLFDKEFKDCPAQYASATEKPRLKWVDVKSKLGDLDTTKLHYVKVPSNLIVIDFDLKDEEGKKDQAKNIEEASKWPPTYAEFSKSGCGIHLHYYYDGDVERLSRIFDKDIEVKVSVGDASLRRRLTACNSLEIATLSSGLPLKGAKKMLDEEQIKSERQLRSLIKKSLRKEIHGHTKPEIDFIHYILEKAYTSGLKYDVRDLRPAVQVFALSSTNQADYCLKTVSKMQFVSENMTENFEKYDEDSIIFFDVEVFPNLFVVVWKRQGKDMPCTVWTNPSPEQIQELTKKKLVGFNNRKYDNHILYARMMGYTEEQLFNLSQRIIDGKDREAMFNEAYNLSYTDIYDFLSAGNKMSLKKWEIKLGIYHLELNLPWNKPVDPSMWAKVGEYCKNDVIATEAVWDANQEDWHAREILALISGLTVNDTTNQCTTRIIIGTDKNAKSKFVYTDLSTIFPGYQYSAYGLPKEVYKEGAKIVAGKSVYMGEDPGEGGRVYANPGIYYNVTVQDIASMHPHSAMKLVIFGKEYTARLSKVVDIRLAIKHKEYETAKSLIHEIAPRDRWKELDELLSDPRGAKGLSGALKTAINSVYGLTAAKFDNKLRDPRNVDNIVAKYGALFMINLQHEVESRGYTVVHIKTDSIKIANATPEIIEFVEEYGKSYGYTFEHESTYSKICLVNEAVYIAQYEDAEVCQARYGYVPEKNREEGGKWTATGAQFQIPYVFKTLFSHEPIDFKDLCETKSVSTALYLDMNEKLPSDKNAAAMIEKFEKKKKKGDWTEDDQIDYDRLLHDIEQCHDYHFVGKVGQFCPVKPGCGGGILLREGDGKFTSVGGTKSQNTGEPYRWLESATVKELGLEDQIDMSYYNDLVDTAIETISQYGDFEQFQTDGHDLQPTWMNIPETEEDGVPFDEIDNIAA